MKFDLKAGFTFSNDISSITKDVKVSVSNFNKILFAKDKTVKIIVNNIQKNIMFIDIMSEGIFRPHNALLQLKNTISKEFGKKHKIGIRDIKIDNYTINFELEKKPLKEVKIPFAKIKIKDKQVSIVIENVDEEFLQRNYIDRMISLVKEKVENQYYEGKEEFWKLI